MRLAIMQPYFFPYLGYFQLYGAADKFVFYDDANWIKSGWINRNRILVGGEPRYMTVPTAGASSFKPINEVEINRNKRGWERKLLATVTQSYSKAPYFNDTLDLLRSVLAADVSTCADLAMRSVQAVAEYVGVSRPVSRSSDHGQSTLKAQDRVIDLCLRENASAYINPDGGRSLYDAARFHKKGIELEFLRPNLPAYPQSGAEFTPALSIIDVAMFCDRHAIGELVRSGIVVPGLERKTLYQ